MLTSLELFLKVIDKVIDLLKHRESSRHKLFHEVIDPLFVALKDVQVEYRKFFAAAEREVFRHPVTDMSRLRFNLSAARVKGLTARQQVEAFAQAARANDKRQEVVAFAAAIEELFYMTGTARSRLSEPKAVIDLLDEVAAGRLTMNALREHIARTIKKVDDQWFQICELHAAARLKITQ